MSRLLDAKNGTRDISLTCDFQPATRDTRRLIKLDKYDTIAISNQLDKVWYNGDTQAGSHSPSFTLLPKDPFQAFENLMLALSKGKKCKEQAKVDNYRNLGI